jgi:cytochrome c oxidase subunit II
MDAATLLHPASQQGQEILDLFYMLLGVAAFIFAVVSSLVVYASIRFRRREGDVEPKPVAENRKLEIIWTVIPSLIVTWLFIATVQVMHAINPPVRQQKADLVVVAHQWWWELHYPASGVTSANEVHLPVGRMQLLRILSADVDHDFWVPALGKKVDAIPNHPNHLWVDINHPGTYLGTCDEFCGAEHAWMRIRVIGQSAADFGAWLQRQSEPAPSPIGPEAQAGERLFMQRTCANCHNIEGTHANGTVAPDLTHLASRETLGSGVFANTPGDLYRWIENPQTIKPGCNMPDLHLSNPDITSLVAYLEELK